MPFKRVLLPKKLKQGDPLTADLIGIGIQFGGSGTKAPNIEDTIVAGSVEGITKPDYRLMSVLVDWLSVHYSRLNVDRLTKLVLSKELVSEPLVRVFWCAFAQSLSDARFSKLSHVYKGSRVDFLGESTEFRVKRKGEDQRFEGTCLRIPNGLFRKRPNDVLTARELAKRHLPYYYRVLIGPSYRADTWAMIQLFPNSTAASLARRTYSDHRTAWEVIRDYRITKRDYSTRGSAA